MQPRFTALRSATVTAEQLCLTGKRNAVGNKAGSTVANSVPVLRRPTSPPTAGRKPEASPPIGSGFDVAVAEFIAPLQACGGPSRLRLQLDSPLHLQTRRAESQTGAGRHWVDDPR